MDKSYGIQDFINIIKQLRSEEGCPWDREQTHDSLRPCAMEEAAELEASIRIYGKTGEYWNMKEELGDLLLQVVMHSIIAEEEGLFRWEDVVQEVSEKMVRRHPHVFGNAEVSDSGEVLRNWEEIKKLEKAGRAGAISPLREIPRELPALARSIKVLKKVQKLYQKESTFEESLNNIGSSLEQLKAVEESAKTAGSIPGCGIEKLIGDILLDISNISRLKNIPQEQILSDQLDDLIDYVEEEASKKKL